MIDVWAWLATPEPIARGVLIILAFVLGALLAGKE